MFLLLLSILLHILLFSYSLSSSSYLSSSYSSYTLVLHYIFISLVLHPCWSNTTTVFVFFCIVILCALHHDVSSFSSFSSSFFSSISPSSSSSSSSSNSSYDYSSYSSSSSFSYYLSYPHILHYIFISPVLHHCLRNTTPLFFYFYIMRITS